MPRWLTAPERGFYRLVGTRADEEQGWKAVLHHGARLHVRLRDPAVRAAAPAGQPAAEPGQPRERELVGLDEHDGELRHEHELAVLRRRVHDVVPEPDGRARSAELRLGGARHGRARRRHPRIRTTLGEHRRELLGRSLPVARLHPPAARGDPGGGAHLAGRRADFRRQGDRDDARGSHAGDRPRAGGVADRDQAARDERRRLLQLELGRPVREPEPVHELHRDALDPPHPGRAGVHVRSHGRVAASGIPDLRGDDGHDDHRDRRCAPSGAARIRRSCATPA